MGVQNRAIWGRRVFRPLVKFHASSSRSISKSTSRSTRNSISKSKRTQKRFRSPGPAACGTGADIFHHGGDSGVNPDVNDLLIGGRTGLSALDITLRHAHTHT